jgi:ribosomal protein S11
MTGVVEEIGLDDQNGSNLAGLRAHAGIEIGQIEDPAPGPHHSERPSAAR